MNGNRFSMKNLMNTVPVPLKSQDPPKETSKRKRKSTQPVSTKVKPYKKKKISAALREQVWIQHGGRVFERKCMVTWCKNTITVFDFQCGHDIPESKGGATDITNLYPICGKCNLSMSNTYTFQQWCKLYNAIPDPVSVLPPPPPSPPPSPSSPTAPKKRSWFRSLFACFS
jgi:5-methylcytosine-specific restriction endonuclease McrA